MTDVRCGCCGRSCWLQQPSSCHVRRPTSIRAELSATMWQGALRVAAALATLAWLASGAAGAGPNADQLSCILTRCAAQATACLGDAGCKATQDCFAACATDDLVCTNSCFFNTANRLFGELAMCSADNGCTISAVVGNQTCPEFAQSPSAAAVDLPATLGEAGTWFVAGGANPVSDCLGCQVVLFEEQPDGALSGRGSSFTNGRRLDTNWTAAAPAGGALDVNYTLFDTIPVEEHWRVVDISDDGDFILMLICGSLLGGAEYVNSQIFSTRANATLPANLTARFDAAIEEAGLGDVLPDIAAYCSIDYSASCQYAPWVPGLGGASTPAASPGSAPAPAPAPAGPTSAAVLGPRQGAVGLTLLAAATATLL